MTNRIKLLRPASFRGIAFDVDSDGKQFGRKIVTHEYPGRDDPFHEDLGQRKQAFSVDAIIGGDDFIVRSAALEAAINQAGPGTLVHPIFGELEVIALSASRRHSYSAVGDVTFSIEFELYGGPKYPLSITDTVSGLSISSSSMLDALSGDFNSVFRAIGVPDFVTADSASRITSLMGNLKAAISEGGLTSFLPGELPDLVASATGFADTVSGVFSMLGNLSQKKSRPMVSTGRPVAAPAPALPLANALLNNASFSASQGLDNGSVRAVNAQSLDNLFQLSSLAASAAAARAAVYDSREQAIDFRDRFAFTTETLRDRVGAAGWDDSWLRSGQVLAALTRDINERIGRLPRTIKIKTSGIRSSLELANRLYGDDAAKIISSAGDIAKRNKAKHPGFLPASDLEVVIDATAR